MTSRIEKVIDKGLARFFLVLLSICMSLILVEVASRIYLNNFATEGQFNTYASLDQLQVRYGEDFFDLSSARLLPHRYLGYYPNPLYHSASGLDKHNQLGYRGEDIEVPKPEGIFRIVALGGSTTYSVGVDDYTLSYPAQLEQLLHDSGYSHVEVVNAGVNSYSSFESFINLQFRVLDLQPNLLIIYHGINDIHPRLVYPPEAYVGDNSGARVTNRSELRMVPLWEHSTVVRMLGIRLGWINSHNSVDNTLIGRPNTFYANLLRAQQRDNTYPDGIFREVSAMEMLDNNPPKYFENNLRSMIAIASEYDVSVVLVTFVHSPLFEDRPRISSDEYQTAFRQNNDVVRLVAETTDAYLYDLVEEMPINKEYFTDGRHFTESGNAYRSQLIANFLIESELILSLP